jgi:hypothetical protein
MITTGPPPKFNDGRDILSCHGASEVADRARADASTVSLALDEDREANES